MCKALLAALSTALALVATAVHADEITPTEMRWLRAGWPVIGYAKAQYLPLDISVQPQAQPGDAPLAMAYVDGRCKLVLAMRGNPDAETTLAQIEPELLTPVIEAMVAHEIGHCWRYVHGAWHTLPAGFVDTSTDGPQRDQENLRLWRDMRETRREEGYADLVGLAWTAQHHPTQYAAVYAWFAKVRDDQPVPGAHHDTRAWLRLVKEARAFAATATPFEQAWPLWRSGLLNED